jgi:NitT/TauT family transport system substrate-binding protein
MLCNDATAYFRRLVLKADFVKVVWVALASWFALSGIAYSQTKPERLRIGYAARAVAHSVPFVAKEAGFFAEEGINAEIIHTAGSIAPMALAANEVDMTIMSAYLMIPVSVQNRDVVMVGGFSRYASMVLVARPEIKSAHDLKGKIVGIQRPGDAYEKSARFALRHIGLDADKDIKMLALGQQ